MRRGGKPTIHIFRDKAEMVGKRISVRVRKIKTGSVYLTFEIQDSSGNPLMFYDPGCYLSQKETLTLADIDQMFEIKMQDPYP